MMPDLDVAAAAVLSWLLTYLVHSTILLAVAAVATWRFADRHEWLDLIWKAAVIGPLVTASLNLGPIPLSLGRRWTVPAVTTAARAPVADRAPLAIADAPIARANDQREVPAVDPVVENRNPVSAAADRSTLWAAVVSRWPLIAVIAWLFVASIAVLRYGRRLRRVYRMLRIGSTATSADLLGTVDRLRSIANEARAIRVTTNAICPVPLALSGRHIVLPPRFFDDLDPEQQRAALAHELAHIVRRDPEWRVAVEVLERALFLQPLNRLARARLCDSAEFLCDEWAVRCTESPLALARCLSIVASWWAPGDTLPAGVSAMARSDSAMVRRVAHILNAPGRIARLRLYWLAIPVAIVTVAAPRVTATHLPAPISIAPAFAAVLGPASVEKASDQREATREWSAAEIAAARAQLRSFRFDRPGASLAERWRQALDDAGRQRLTDFWMVYTFNTPTHADDIMFSDSRDGSTFVSSNGRIFTEGPPLTDLIGSSTVLLEGGNLAVLLHYRGARADAIDRASYRSVQLGFDFGRTPVFWLGDASESNSFERVQDLFGLARDRKLQLFLIELASLHSDSNVVIPFLTRLVEPSWPPEIRSEAAEGFDHHHDPRSVEILLRVARNDSDSGVRAEAAETIGEVQTPQSIPALVELVESADPAVRSEAAEAFGAQPAERALPAIEEVIATTEHDEVLNEAIEAIGELRDQSALALLLQIANTHPNRKAQQEAVETLGDLGAPGVVDALTRIVWEHADVAIQREAVETLGDRHDDAGAMAALERIVREHEREEVQAEAIETIADEQSMHPLVLELAVSGRSARIRREALDSIGEAVGKTSDAQRLDRAQAVVERAVFDDPDRGVQVDALDALDEFPADRAVRALRDVIARHPDARVRREAEQHLRERQ